MLYVVRLINRLEPPGLRPVGPADRQQKGGLKVCPTCISFSQQSATSAAEERVCLISFCISDFAAQMLADAQPTYVRQTDVVGIWVFIAWSGCTCEVQMFRKVHGQPS